jgi:hypothetical protein
MVHLSFDIELDPVIVDQWMSEYIELTKLVNRPLTKEQD